VTFREVFMEGLYEFDEYGDPKVIVDAGANVGLSSVFFAMRFPAARIVALEPDPDNARMARLNTRAFENVALIEAALMASGGLARKLEGPFNADSYRFSPATVQDGDSVPAVTVDALMRQQGFDTIDLLKMDIEGSERDVLASSSTWLSRVKVLALELHEDLAPGAREVFEREVASRSRRVVTQGTTTFALL
jgi:FkbM family methyltransferase